MKEGGLSPYYTNPLCKTCVVQARAETITAYLYIHFTIIESSTEIKICDNI